MVNLLLNGPLSCNHGAFELHGGGGRCVVRVANAKMPSYVVCVRPEGRVMVQELGRRMAKLEPKADGDGIRSWCWWLFHESDPQSRTVSNVLTPEVFGLFSRDFAAPTDPETLR